MMLNPRYVDSREAPERRTPLERAGFTVKALASGDVQFPEAGGGTVLVENKKVEQLLADMASGQLLNQGRRLAESCEFPILAIEGRWAQLNGHLLDSRYTWEQVWNQLQTLQDMGLRVQLTTGPEHTVQRILELAEYYAKGVHQSALRQRGGDPRLGALALIHGLGGSGAKALLEGFSTLQAVAQADREALEGVPGIGPVLSKRIYEFWR